MAFELTLPKRRTATGRRSWHGMAFIMEALVLLVFLVISIALLMQLFTMAKSHDENASALTASVILASNEAERFAVDPLSETTGYYALDGEMIVEVDADHEGAFKVQRAVESQSAPAGTLYYATITVEQHSASIYESTSARYVPDEEVSR